MAQGDLVIFDEAKLALVDGTHDLDTHAFKVAILDNTTTPLAADATPVLADYTEVGVGGIYVAGGLALTVSLTEVGGVVTYDFTNNPSWAADAGNDVDAYWGLVYNNTNVGKEALGFVDLAGPVDMSAIALTLTWNVNGFFTLT